jgi:hypothetical protein
VADLVDKYDAGGVTDYALQTARSTARDELRGIVARIGNDKCAEVAGLSESHLSTALSTKSKTDRNLDDRHVDAILRLATPSERVRYFTARLRAFGLRATETRERSDFEKLRDLEYDVATACGAVGAEIVEKSRRRL